MLQRFACPPAVPAPVILPVDQRFLTPECVQIGIGLSNYLDQGHIKCASGKRLLVRPGSGVELQSTPSSRNCVPGCPRPPRADHHRAAVTAVELLDTCVSPSLLAPPLLQGQASLRSQAEPLPKSDCAHIRSMLPGCTPRTLVCTALRGASPARQGLFNQRHRDSARMPVPVGPRQNASSRMPFEVKEKLCVARRRRRIHPRFVKGKDLWHEGGGHVVDGLDLTGLGRRRSLLLISG
jgi:hypothetical protein